MTPTAQIAVDQPLLVMAITTTYSEPPPRGHVPLPWNNEPQRVATRLRRRSAAVVYWLDTIGPSDVLDVSGQVPPKLMSEIRKQMEEWLDAESETQE
jgi:hypothetical protein